MQEVYKEVDIGCAQVCRREKLHQKSRHDGAIKNTRGDVRRRRRGRLGWARLEPHSWQTSGTPPGGERVADTLQTPSW